jgi:hypothetical protein
MAFFTGNVFDAAKKVSSKVQSMADKAKSAAIRAQSGDGDPTTPFSPLAPTVQQQLNGQAEQNLLGAGNVINDRITGDAFNAAAIQQRQGLARYEQNQRAQNAQQIHQAGFAGTPIGSMYANATEADLARNRFDTNLGIEVARQDARMQGAQAAQDYANNVNRFQTEQQTAQQTRYTDAQKNFSDAALANKWFDTIDAAGSTPMARETAINTLRNSDPQFNQNMQALWEASGGPGAFTNEFAYDKLNAIDRTTNVKRVLTDLADSFFPDDPEMAGMFVDGLINMTTESMGLTIVKDDDGKFTIRKIEDVENEKEDEEKAKEKALDDKVRSMTGTVSDVEGLSGDELYEVLEKLKEKGQIVNGIGSRGNNVERGADGYKDLNDAATNGKIVFYNGNYYYVTARSMEDGGWLDFKHAYFNYTLKAIDGGAEITISGKR